jgi:uncharacterized membrane protein
MTSLVSGRRLMLVLVSLAVLAACSNSEPVPPFAPSAGAQQRSAPSGIVPASEGKVPRYTIVKLDTLGGSSALANGVNNRGLVSGDANLPGNGRQHGVLWRSQKAIDLGTLGGPNSVANWPPNESAAVAVLAETSTPDPLGEDFCAFGTHLVCQGFVSRRGIHGRRLGPFSGGDNSQPQAMNDRGQVSGYAENGVHDPTCVAPQVLQFRGAVWEAESGKMRELRPIAPDRDSVGFDINDRGDVVGASGVCGDANSSQYARHAVLWQHGSPLYLGNL